MIGNVNVTVGWVIRNPRWCFLVLNYNDYKAWLQWAELQGAVNPMNTTIIGADVSQDGLAYPSIQVTKTVVIGNYLFVIGYTYNKMNVTVGSTYNIGIFVYPANAYITSGTYEGNWTGSIP